MKRIVIKILLSVGFVVLVFVAGRFSATWYPVEMTTATSAMSTNMPEKQPLYWYDPMFPQQHFEQAGKSPFMDMDLVPKYADESGDGNDPAVRINAQMAQNIGIRYATVTRKTVAPEVLATATLQFNQRDVAIAQARVGGFVTAVAALAPGDRVVRDQVLLHFRAPEWSAAFDEWLLLQASGNDEWRTLATQRLRQLGIHEDDIAAVKKSGVVPEQFALRAPQNGVIDTLDARAGMTLTMGQTVARIVADDPLWLDVAVPQQALDWLRRDQRAELRFAAFESRVFKGRITQILPELDQRSGAVRVRIELPNHDGQLRAGLVAQVRLSGDTREALTVATEAIVRSGQQTVLILADDEQTFRPVVVEVGGEFGDISEIVSGINDGARVVRSGQFLIDSEASLSGVLARLSPPQEAQP